MHCWDPKPFQKNGCSSYGIIWLEWLLLLPETRVALFLQKPYKYFSKGDLLRFYGVT